VDKVVVSNRLEAEDLPPWEATTRILRSDNLYSEIAALKQQPGRDILVILSRQLWNDLLLQRSDRRTAPDHLSGRRRCGDPAVHRPAAGFPQAAQHPYLGGVGQHPRCVPAGPGGKASA
jgi:hypothetical protein